MAKKTEPAEPQKPARVRLDLPPDYLPDLRVMAAEEGVSMAEFARTTMVQLVDKWRVKKAAGK